MSDICNRQHGRKEHISGYIKSILFTIKSKIVNYTTDQFSTKNCITVSFLNVTNVFNMHTLHILYHLLANKISFSTDK